MIKKFIFLFTLLNIFVANAQWTTDTAVNTLVSDISSDGMDTMGTSTGGTYIVFWKRIETPTSATYELWAQYLDESGNRSLGNDGVMISNTLPMVGYTNMSKISVDKNDNLYIGVTGTGAGTPCVVYKINKSGEILWQKTLGSGYLPTFLHTSNGDVIISYAPATGGTSKMMRYTTDGTALWPATVDITPSTAYANKSTFASDIYEHPNGDFTVVFQVKVSYTTASLPFAQRFNSEGVALWAQSLQLANKGTNYNATYSGAVDGDVVYYGYSLITVSAYDGFVQKINPDGTLPWGINGMDMDPTDTYMEKNAIMAFEPGSHSIWMIANYSTSGQGMLGERIQKFDKETGARQFTDNAKEIYPVDEEARIHKGDLYLLNDKPLFILKSGYDNSGNSPTTLSAVFLDENGNLATSILPVATFAGNKDEVTLNKPVNNYAVVAFLEYRNEEQINYLYAQRFSTELNESCTVTPGILEDITSACAITATDLTAPTATDSCGTVVTATTNAAFPLTQGTTAITWTFTSSTGATATQTQNIIVNDTTAPVLIVQNITVEVGDDATVTVDPTLLNNGSTDECGTTNGWTWTVSPSGLSCIPGDKNVTITVTDLNGNTSTATAVVTVTDPNNYCGTAGTDEFEQNKVVLYPNPTQDEFNITSPTAISNVVIYDMLGKTIYSTTASQNNITIDSKGWSAGVYNISIENANGAQQRLKLLKN